VGHIISRAVSIVSCQTKRGEGSRPRPAVAGSLSEPITDPIKRLAISTAQTCSRRAGTRALPVTWHSRRLVALNAYGQLPDERHAIYGVGH